jgi:carboxynorspermidine decarboxylase
MIKPYKPTPAFVLQENKLISNLELLDSVRKAADIEIILALKGFSMWSVFPLVKQYLGGATASSLHEATLINEYMGCKAHTYCAAFIPHEFDQIAHLSSHLVFNSLSEFQRYKSRIPLYPKVSFGLRVNPGYSEVGTDLYNPVLPGSRLGVSEESLKEHWPEELEGMHFHSLCENNSFTLEKTLQSLEQKYGHWFSKIKWINMGGGHLITHRDYDVQHLIQLLKDFKSRHNVEIILEPGSAIAWQTGYLCSSVLDIVDNAGIKTLMMDISFTAHMPDTLEMPYRPVIQGASDWDKNNPFSYRIGGMSCLSGDFMQEYSFEKEMKVGDVLIFEDMMHYTMVKTTMFNGVGHPSIVVQKPNGDFDLIRKFDYQDFKSRLS